MSGLVVPEIGTSTPTEYDIKAKKQLRKLIQQEPALPVPNIRYVQDTDWFKPSIDEVVITSSDKWPALISASYYGDISKVKALVISGKCDINMVTKEEGMSALMMASYAGHTKIAELLIQYDAHVNMQNKEGWSSLMLASQNGHTETVSLLLRSGACVNTQALTIASQNGHTKTVSLLLQNGAQVNMQDDDGLTSLMLASQNGHTETVSLLLKNGAHINVQNNKGVSSLMRASYKGHAETVSLLLQNGACVNMQDKEGLSSLIISSQNGHTETVSLLLKNGAYINMWSNGGVSSLMRASYEGHTETVSLLLQNSAQVNIQDNEGWSPLMLSSQNGHTETVSVLLQNGAHVNMKNIEGSSSLMLASQTGQTETVSLLLQNGARVNMQDNEGLSSLVRASYEGHTETGSVLLHNGARVNMQTNGGWSSLMLACQNGHTETVSSLLRNSANINMQNNEGSSSLMLASQNGHTETVSLLLQNGAHVNMQDNRESSSLLRAIYKGHTKTVSVLLQNGALVNIQNNEGWSPLTIVSQNGHTETVSLLLQNGAHVNMQNNGGISSLMLASHKGHNETVSVLLQNGAQVNMQSNEGLSSLILASESGHTKIVSVLLQNGALVNMQSNEGWSSLITASKNGHTEIVSLLLQNGAQVNMQTKEGGSALIAASQLGHSEIVSLLLQNDTHINMHVDALMVAAFNGQHEVVIILLNNANLQLQNNIKLGLTCLILACVGGHYDAAKVLLEHGACAVEASLYYAISSGNVKLIDLMITSSQIQSPSEMVKLDKSKTDLFKALHSAITCKNSTVAHFALEGCFAIIQGRFPLNTDSDYPGICFFNACNQNLVTLQGCRIQNIGLSIYIPPQSLADEKAAHLLIQPCFNGPFELPAGCMSASPAYLIQPSRKIKLKKDVILRMHHYVHLETEEDCQEMMFVSASLIPQGGVYKFKEIVGAKSMFWPNNPVGKIVLRHFCLLKIVRGISNLRGRRRIHPQGDNIYSARLYRNMFPDAFSQIRAVFCMCLNHPIYTEHCNKRIKGILEHSEEPSVTNGPMVSGEVKLNVMDHSNRWEVKFDKEPPEISKRDLHVPESELHRDPDYPPKLVIFVRPTSAEEMSTGQMADLQLQVKGLDSKDSTFQLITPSIKSSLSAVSLQSQQSQQTGASHSILETPPPVVWLQKATPPHFTEVEELSKLPENMLGIENLASVLKELDNVAYEWKKFGDCLELNYSKMKKIEQLIRGSTDPATDGMRELLAWWLKGNGARPITWQTIIAALEQIEEPELANSIKAKFCTKSIS